MIKMICKKCGHNVDKYDVIPCHDGMHCPCGEKLFKLTKNSKRAGKTKQYRLKLKIEELERRLKILT